MQEMMKAMMGGQGGDPAEMEEMQRTCSHSERSSLILMLVGCYP